MPALVKATLQDISDPKKPEPVEVQFNPQTLKLGLASRVEGGDSKGRQVRQWIGKTSTTLSFDLHFDTADEGTTDSPVSVRSKTAMVEKYVLPMKEVTEKQATPKVRFTWGELVFEGIIESLSVDFDLFAADGTPLRAKMSVTIKEQDAKYQLGELGPAANKSNAQPPGGGGAGPGSIGGGASLALTATALQGESAADFLARNGVDPAAWRGIAGQLGSTLSLQGGAEVDFSAGLSVGGGIGVAAGIEAGATASLEASFGLSVDARASASLGASGNASTTAGFALSAAGGVSAAIETVAIARTETAAATARSAFGPPAPAAAAPPSGGSAVTRTAGSGSLPAATPSAAAAGNLVLTPTPGAAASPKRPDQPRPALAVHGLPSPAMQAAAAPAPPPPVADPRAIAFGFGVPLRPRIGNAAALRTGLLAGRIALRPHAHTTDVLTPDDPTAAPWARLPADRSRTEADTVQRQRHPPQPCGCAGICSHRGGRR